MSPQLASNVKEWRSHVARSRRCRTGAVAGRTIVGLALVAQAASALEQVGAMSDPRTNEAVALMLGYAERTGLATGRPPRRYLWTDAFAVCNFLGLARATGNERLAQLALHLVDQVHRTLGRHRPDDARKGWISGLSEREGAAHPTQGGLRIGKERPERRPDEVFDEQLEWDRDGQYFHYLTKWMHALDQATRATGQPQYAIWARELAQTAEHAFTHQTSARSQAPRIYWKMSIDLTRPLVPAMGQHDPLDGYVTFVQLRATAARLPPAVREPGVDTEIRHFAGMVQTGQWATDDPLGIGGLLFDAHRVNQLIQQGAPGDEGLVVDLLAAALNGLRHYVQRGESALPIEYRLAFRELGLVIGLHAVERMWQAAAREADAATLHPALRAPLEALREYLPLASEIESFWRHPEHRRATTWLEHRDINDVMLATSLAPEGFLTLSAPAGR